jgi:hypothetical protein
MDMRATFNVFPPMERANQRRNVRTAEFHDPRHRNGLGQGWEGKGIRDVCCLYTTMTTAVRKIAFSNNN